MAVFQEFDIVRVARFLRSSRHIGGTDGVKRSPQIGDVGTICHVYAPGTQDSVVAVEMVDEHGMTIWLADFSPDELDLVSRPKS